MQPCHVRLQPHIWSQTYPFQKSDTVIENCVDVRGTVQALPWGEFVLCQAGGHHLVFYASPLWRVPQGSILAPVLFPLYLLPLILIFKTYGIHYHLYADENIQIYFQPIFVQAPDTPLVLS